MNYTNLAHVLKYSFTTREDFEHKIDENPLESINHLIYADWLDEHGEQDEAAFRRSIGNWMKKEGRFARPTPDTEDTQWTSDSRFLPKGISDVDIPWNQETNPWTTWPTYRHMEDAFRQAFLANLQRQRA